MWTRAIQIASIGMALVLSAIAGAAPLVNGRFETGDLTGWNCGETGFYPFGSDMLGATTVLGGLTVPSVGPTQGSYMAMLSNGGIDTLSNINHGLPPGLPLCPSGGDGPIGVDVHDEKFEPFFATIPNGPNAIWNMQELWQTFSVNGPKKLTFDWNFLSNDSAADWAFAAINYDPIQLLAPSAGIGPGSLPDESAGQYARQTGWLTSQFFLPDAGTYTLTFGVVNGSLDGFLSSALLVDNVQVKALPEPAMPLLVLTAIGALVGVSTRARSAVCGLVGIPGQTVRSIAPL